MKIKHILIIEDDFEIRESLKYVLEMDGFVVHGSVNGQEGLNYLLKTENLPQLILLDIMMPVMDGYKFRQAQLNHQTIAHIPTIVLSADRNFQITGQDLQFHSMLKKPVDLDHLLELISEL